VSRVLVVDDEVLFTNVVRRVLRDHHHVTVCNHTDDAVARFEAGERFDAIVCDLMMPRLGGMGLYARVLELAPDQAARFIFVTAGTTTLAAKEFLSGRTNPTLEKPCDFKELRALVTKVVSAKSSR
jgi:CheY-like chemotaxis protein